MKPSISGIPGMPGMPEMLGEEVLQVAPRRTGTSFREEKETSVQQRTYFPETWLWDLLEISLVLMRASVMSLFLFIFSVMLICLLTYASFSRVS